MSSVAGRGFSRAGGRLSERAYDHVRRAILSGEYPIGSVVSDGQIAEELGMSKTPVRQALKLLAQEGLLETGPRRQLVVCGISPERREEVLEIREALERIAVGHACRAMPIDDVDQLRVALFRQRRAAEARDESAFIELDEEFHLRIAEAARLPILVRFLDQLRGFVRVMRLGSARHPSDLPQVIEEHEAIVDALEDRDGDAALDALMHHLHKSDYVGDRRGARKEKVAR